MHDANMFDKQGMDRSTRTPTLSQVRAVCSQREPTGRAIIVIVTEREEERERRKRKRTNEENDGSVCLNTCPRFAGTHGSVLDLHTETF